MHCKSDHEWPLARLIHVHERRSDVLDLKICCRVSHRPGLISVVWSAKATRRLLAVACPSAHVSTLRGPYHAAHAEIANSEIPVRVLGPSVEDLAWTDLGACSEP